MSVNIGLNDLIVIFSLIASIVAAFKFLFIPFSDYIKNNAINKYEMEAMKKDIEDLENRVNYLEKK